MGSPVEELTKLGDCTASKGTALDIGSGAVTFSLVKPTASRFACHRNKRLHAVTCRRLYSATVRPAHGRMAANDSIVPPSSKFQCGAGLPLAPRRLKPLCGPISHPQKVPSNSGY